MDTKTVYLMPPLTVAAEADVAQLKLEVAEQLDVATTFTDGPALAWMNWAWAGPVEQVKVGLD
jgi:hypothetical protein